MRSPDGLDRPSMTRVRPGHRVSTPHHHHALHGARPSHHHHHGDHGALPAPHAADALISARNLMLARGGRTILADIDIDIGPARSSPS